MASQEALGRVFRGCRDGSIGIEVRRLGDSEIEDATPKRGRGLEDHPLKRKFPLSTAVKRCNAPGCVSSSKAGRGIERVAGGRCVETVDCSLWILYRTFDLLANVLPPLRATNSRNKIKTELLLYFKHGASTWLAGLGGRFDALFVPFETSRGQLGVQLVQIEGAAPSVEGG